MWAVGGSFGLGAERSLCGEGRAGQGVPAPSWTVPLFAAAVLAEDKVTLVPLVEGSEEFRETVRHFYDTLEDLHNKIRVVKVPRMGPGRACWCPCGGRGLSVHMG